MINLADMKCSKVTAASQKLNSDEIGQYQAMLPDWEIYNKDGEPRLEKVFKFADFTQAMNFTNLVAKIANDEDHHPAILTEWGKVTITWWTHRIHSLHLNDFIMAAKTDSLYRRN